MMAICANVLLFLAVIITKSGYHAFEVSIQTFNSLPVIGEDFTLFCTFTPETRNRRLIWTKGNNIVVASHSCVLYPACKWVTAPDRSKFSLMADTRSGNLTFKNLFRNDSDNYQCAVSSTFGEKRTGSTSLQVTPLSPVPPYLLRISDESFSRYYHNNTNITVTAGEPHNITCAAYGAIPHAVLEWRIADDVEVVLQDQANVAQSYSYISLKIVTITPSRNDQGKYLRCVASHPKLQHHLQCSVHLNVHVPPSSMLLFLAEDNKERNSGSTFIHVQEGTSTSITCTSIGSFPAVELSWTLLGDTNSTPGNSSLSKFPNDLDRSLFDTESTIAIYPQRGHHRKFIQCYVSLAKVYIDLLKAKLIVYGPPESVNITTPGDLYDSRETNVSCRAVNGYPAPLILWYIGSRNVTHNSSLKTSVTVDGRYDAESTLTLIPKRSDHGKPLLCQAVQHTRPSMRLVNDSVVLNISYDPVVFITFRRLTSNTARTGFVLTCTSDANPPAFIFQWFCNGTQFPNETCNIKFSETIIEGETLTSSQVVIRNPLSEAPCDLKCIAVSSNGSGSAVFIFTSVRTEVSIGPDDDTVLMTFGRDLCSKPADVTASSGLNDPPFPRRKTLIMTIALGVIASAGLILLISLGLMYFYGTLCCVKRRKDDGDNTQPQGRMVDGDGLVYMSVSHDRAHPPNAPPIQTEEPTVYASLNPEVTQRRKEEMEYADTKATTPDGQPMYGNYLVKKRNRQEQARIPPPVQTDDATYNAECMDCRKGGMTGGIGPTTLDDPMYANYLVKMRKDEERAKQIASNHDAFEMYGI